MLKAAECMCLMFSGGIFQKSISKVALRLKQHVWIIFFSQVPLLSCQILELYKSLN